MRRIFSIYSVFALSLMIWTTPVIASPPAKQATDPNAHSPAGVVYSIPLDTARQDAAPHHRASGSPSGGSGGSGGGSGGGASTGGGSGAPAAGSGAPAAGSSSGAGAAGSGISSASGSGSGSRGGSQPGSSSVEARPPVLVPGGQPGSLIHSANGFGSSSSVPGLNGTPAAGLGAVQSNASSAPLLAALLSLIVLTVGALIGARAWRAPRDRRDTGAG